MKSLYDIIKGKILVAGFFLLLLLSALCYAGSSGLHEVRWVDDGDTVVLADGRRVRYIGINAPEVESDYSKAEPFGNEAKELNKNLVYLKKVRLEFDNEKIDQYGRLLAYVFLENGKLVNNAIVEAGYAYCLPRMPNTKYEEIFLKSQQKAIESNKGIWLNINDDSGRYTGNKKSKRFHVETCFYARKIDKKSIKIYTGKREAYMDGYAPCRKCLGQNSREY
jgi:micrococcal nuclease